MKRAILLFLCLCLFLCSCGAEQDAPSQENVITISFEYGERTGSYIGDTDKDGLPHGYGIFSSENPDGTSWTYTGEWDHGHWNGQGQTAWSTGETYTGSYANDVINGLGIYTSPTGEISIRNIHGALNGHGMFVTPEGITVMGNFVDGSPSGYCSLYLTDDYDGYVFWGCFADSNAEGLIYTPVGDSFPATYLDGEIKFIPDSTIDFTANDLAQEETTVTESEAAETVSQLEITSGMRNALRAAQNYLSLMPFSYDGLIEQLEYEKYSHEEAIYAADHCGADWYEQAAKAAKNYLELMSFSRGGMIEQLEYVGYTSEQAAYAADQNGL